MNNQDNVIRFDEFYGTTYDSYGGSGCMVRNENHKRRWGSKKIEDINVGDYVSHKYLGVPFDFDA